MVNADVELLRAACCIAGLDGEIHKREMAALDKLADRAGVGSASLHAMIDMAKTDPDFYKKQLGFVQKDPERSLQILARVAELDGEAALAERVILYHFAKTMGISDERAEEIVPKS